MPAPALVSDAFRILSALRCCYPRLHICAERGRRHGRGRNSKEYLVLPRRERAVPDALPLQQQKCLLPSLANWYVCLSLVMDHVSKRHVKVWSADNAAAMMCSGRTEQSFYFQVRRLCREQYFRGARNTARYRRPLFLHTHLIQFATFRNRA